MSKVYFFRGDQYSRYDAKRDAADPQYPRAIAGQWAGLETVPIDAALNWGNGRAYFFSGSRYYRYDIKRDRTDGQPRAIADGWRGLTLDRVDACVNWGNGKVWFFRGNQYWQYDHAHDRTDAGYPQPIRAKWDAGFATDIQAALNYGNGKLYFFKDDRYVRYDVKSQSVESGWPKRIQGAWAGLFDSNVRAPVMLGYSGFDRLVYPGDDVMRYLWESTNSTWCGFYLAPSPSQKHTSWMSRFPFLRSMGWGIAPIYVGQQQPEPTPDNSAHNISAAQGSIDGADAVQLAGAAAIPAGSVIYLDIETGNPIQPGLADYYRAWNDAVVARHFRPGVYCSFLQARALKALDDRPAFWTFNINGPLFCPAEGSTLPRTGESRNGRTAQYQTPFPAPEPLLCGVEFAAAWQLAQDAVLLMPAGQTVVGIDFNSCCRPDPSQIP
jgi:hypothetical protein